MFTRLRSDPDDVREYEAMKVRLNNPKLTWEAFMNGDVDKYYDKRFAYETKNSPMTRRDIRPPSFMKSGGKKRRSRRKSTRRKRSTPRHKRTRRRSTKKRRSTRRRSRH